MNYYDESAKKRHKKIDVENIDIKEECGDKNCADGNTPGDINFKAEGCSGKKCKKDVVDFETESAKSKNKKSKKDCCGNDECTETECKKNKKSKKDDDSVDFETESCKSKKSKKDVDIDFETESANKKSSLDNYKRSKDDNKAFLRMNDWDWQHGAAFRKEVNKAVDDDRANGNIPEDPLTSAVVDKYYNIAHDEVKKEREEKEKYYEGKRQKHEMKKDVDFKNNNKRSSLDHRNRVKDIDKAFAKTEDPNWPHHAAFRKEVNKAVDDDRANGNIPEDPLTSAVVDKYYNIAHDEVKKEREKPLKYREGKRQKSTMKKDIDFGTESAKCKGKKCKKNQELEIDEENLNDTKKKKKAMFDQECGDTPIPKKTKIIKEEDDADLGIDPADADINVDNISLEYMVSSLDDAAINSLDAERQVMTAMAEELYKEYLMIDYNLSDDCYAEYATDNDSDEEVIQERFFGGAGKSAAGIAKPVVKGAKRLNDIKHGVGRHGIIRNVVHRTKKDLHEGGTVYKLLTWPFLLLKNTVQTVYHKTKSFITYKGLLLGVEVKINREIKKLRKNFRNMPKAALAGGIGYATTTLNSMAKGEGAQLDPLEFIAHEGSNLIAELGHDTMLRALTNKLADAVENSPEKIRQVIAERNKGTKEKLTPSDGENASTVLSIKDNKITAEHLVNLVGINGMIDDIDRWSDICENVARDVSNGNEGNISGYLTQAKSIQDKYMDNDKVNYEIIYSKNSSAVKISDFYAEFADKLVDKAKSLEKGLDKISGLENVIKDAEGQLSETTEKTLAELNVVMQHTCNAFMEIIGTLDDLGKYVANTMNQYLNCLTAANSIKANRNGKNDNEE